MNSVIVIGSGPAGHTACIYLARANLKPIMLEGDSSGLVVSGGLLTTTKTVENFPGFPNGVEGMELTDNFRKQSINYGTEIRSETVTKIEKTEDNLFKVVTKENSYLTKAVIIATGSTPKRLDIEGWTKYWNKGISTCAVCDGGLPRYRAVPIAVVGGGDSACEEALHLSKTASIVYMIVRRDRFRASKIMSDRVLRHQKIKIIWHSEVEEVRGGDKGVESIIIKDNHGDKLHILEVKGLFVAIGHSPNSEFVREFVECNEEGYIRTGVDMSTSVEGVWAAGDVQDPKYRQAITAAGTGCMAALEVERWLSLRE